MAFRPVFLSAPFLSAPGVLRPDFIFSGFMYEALWPGFLQSPPIGAFYPAGAVAGKRVLIPIGS